MSELHPWATTVRLGIPPEQLWDLLWRSECQPRWLGPGAAIRLAVGHRLALVDEAGRWRTARTTLVERPGRVEMVVDPATGWTDQPPTTMAITLEAAGTGTRLDVSEVGVHPAHLDEVDRYWAGRLRALDELVGRALRRRRDLRQAVVVIHGIGEQQPGDTLRALADSGVLSEAAQIPPARSSGASRVPAGQADSADGSHPVRPPHTQGLWVKPDHVSQSFELRRITVEGTANCPPTDTFELYWAHLIRDTTMAQLTSWLRDLLLRWPVPGPLRPFWLAGWLVVVTVVAGGVAALLAPDVVAWLAGAAVVATIATVARIAWQGLGRTAAIQVLGDAARYLVPRPANIAHRQAIREAGVDLLLQLHESGRYDRVVLVGHSLGSVIAYDVITHAWIQLHARHRSPSEAHFSLVREPEKQVDLADPTAAQGNQHAAWRQLRANTQPWLVTDLITIGSPLTYADFLMADGHEEFEARQQDRTLPTCPPTTEVVRARKGQEHRRMTFERSYRDPVDGTARTFTRFHHAAPFAVTRWTNLYFRTRRVGTAGDLVGGPVAPMFGHWVRDVGMDSPWRGFAHTRYWTPGPDGRNAHLDALREALALDTRLELLGVTAALPAFAQVSRGMPNERNEDDDGARG